MMSLSIGMLSHPLGGIFPKTLSEATRKSEVKCAIETRSYTRCVLMMNVFPYINQMSTFAGFFWKGVWDTFGI